MDLVQILANLDWCLPSDETGIQNVQSIVSTIILVIQIAVPVLLVIFGMLDLGKAVVASKEDDIKKGQQLFIKRLISAALVFLVIFVVKILISVIAPTSYENINAWNCINAFLNGPDANSKSGNQ